MISQPKRTVTNQNLGSSNEKESLIVITRVASPEPVQPKASVPLIEPILDPVFEELIYGGVGSGIKKSNDDEEEDSVEVVEVGQGRDFYNDD